MGMAETIKALEGWHGFSASPAGVASAVMEVSSGGYRVSAKDPHPALWVDQGDAVQAFHESTVAYIVEKYGQLGDRYRWWWHRAPALEKHQMTEMDAKGSQRLVQDRWAVSAAVGVSGG